MNPVESILLENIDNPKSLFVFPTDVAASRWADHLLRLRTGEGSGSVAMNKFIAWDIFKQNSVKSKVQNKKSIPSALRKIFIHRLLKENASACEQGSTPLFTSLIRAQWSQQASHFAPWLTRILPQLGTWFNKTADLTIDSILSEKAEKAAVNFEGDDRDMFTLARRYAQFLEKNGLFEPAWETPPFNDEGMECFIFFPESLSDYSEYRDLLSESGHVKIISAEDKADETNSKTNDTFFYTNSRREITEAALYIRALHEKQGINWDSIAVCLPDSKYYEPYVTREFTNRNIPFVKRTGKPLTDYPAGSFFSSVLDCVSQDFSFSSLVGLIMNKKLPWKNTAQINNLIAFGINNNCLFSWTEEKDGEKQTINVWEDAFVKPYGGIEPKTREFFNNLKKRLQAMRSAATFSQLRTQYFIFREQFIDIEDCIEETDLVLSRCISELMNLAELEKDFPQEGEIDHFLFFSDYLSEISYLPRQKTSGVAILPYKTAAAAPFDCHIILGAGQDSLSVVNTRLDFLPRKKREELGIFDEDSSGAFINLHKFNSVKNSAFFCSEQTFSGFTIPHSKIGSPSEPRDRYSTDPILGQKFSFDYYNAERALCRSLAEKEAFDLKELHENQINGFFEWNNRRQKSTIDEKWKTNKKTQELISSIYAKNGKLSVSASSLQPYFQCSLKWLFERVFALENVEIETSLMAQNISGLVYHAVLNQFLTEIKNSNEALQKPVDDGSALILPDEYRRLLERSVDAVFESFPSLKTGERTQMSALTSRLLSAGKKEFQYHLENCLVQFLSFFAGCRVVGSETAYQLERDSFILKGIVDCILIDSQDMSENKYIIVDFKLKRIPDRDDCTGEGENGLSNFQLPMYITLTEENEKFKIYTALFYSILDSKADVLIGMVQDMNTNRVIPKKEDERITGGSEMYNRIFKEFRKKTEQFSKEVSSGNFGVFVSKYSNCLDCDYHRICRTVYVIDRGNIKKSEKY